MYREGSNDMYFLQLKGANISAPLCVTSNYCWESTFRAGQNDPHVTVKIILLSQVKFALLFIG